MTKNNLVTLTVTFIKSTEQYVEVTSNGEKSIYFPLIALPDPSIDLSAHAEGDFISLEIPQWLADNEQLEFHQGES
jgi:hypothetical protein